MNKYYIVISTWYVDEYDNGTMEVRKVFTDKELANKYCEEKNKEPRIYNNIKEEWEVVEETD